MKRNRIILACLSIATTLMAVGCSVKTLDTQIENNVIEDSTSAEDTTIVETTEENTTTEETPESNNKYATKTSWCAPYHYLFAVEREDCDCVKLQDGIYHFYSEKINEPGDQKIAAWEIHVTKDVIDDIDALQNTDDTYQGFVGGENNEELTLVLNKGYYVFIKSLHTENTMVTSEIKIEKIG